ncbi:BrnT family toxin [Agrobacterium genomosp. 3]|uniref:BrnT family toxin n=1 Tax=Agrobacterium tumefaciens TaxID=358 RepID=A0AAE6EJP0_AGRTU|nr:MULTISPECIES: BrnT family toxin [Rhizobium/Agrobacterium group]MCA1868054.1 BrnT family toxin [Agrobacterium tomkonis]MCA2379079.1 BrnT family toxin [Agrobacterium tomkonis RTP8]MCA1878405.1 BrnT family toxin [Agrobacterium tumefaciens]MCA1893660.1 BrnT family toxin [Agrobacterium tomkonis]MCA2374459.1 BrnT family toxin [Agrobacterium tomkonis CIP 111-78]
MLYFEWNEHKASANLAKHGVSFETARGVFDDPFAVDIEDRSANYGEVRRRIVGLANGLVLTVIYTERSEVIRIISARKATRAERKEYDDNGW